MKVTAEKREGDVVLSIQAEPEEVEKAKERAYRRLVNRYTVPGFRRGKAPRAMLERYIGPTVLLNEALSLMVPELYDQALKDQGIDSIAKPEMEVTSYDPITVKATVPVRPVVELGDYRSVRVAAEKVEIADEQVEQALEQVRLGRARWEPVERPVEMGDNVIMDLQGTSEGRKIADQTGLSPYLVRPGGDQPVPGFAEEMVGIEAGQEKTIHLSFPADYAVDRVAGREYEYRVTVRRVEGRQLPELDDELARALGIDGVGSLEQLRSYVREALQREAEAAARSRLEEQVLSSVLAASRVEFPSMLVDQQLEAMLRGQAEQLRQSGIAVEQWLKYIGKTESQYREELRPQATNAVARELLLQEVIKGEAIEAEEAEIDHQLMHVVQDAKAPPRREGLAGGIQRVKAVRRLVEIATEGAVVYPSLAEHAGHAHEDEEAETAAGVQPEAGASEVRAAVESAPQAEAAPPAVVEGSDATPGEVTDTASGGKGAAKATGE